MTKRIFASAIGAALVSLFCSLQPAHAQLVSLGEVALSPTSGSVTATPIFQSATTSAACPAGFGEDASLRIGPPGGPFTNLAPPAGGGGFDSGPVTTEPNRSFETALGGRPANGDWWVVVECFSLTAGRHPERFIAPITVAGESWQVGSSGEIPAQATAPNDGTSAEQDLLLTIPSEEPTPSPTPNPTPSASQTSGGGGSGGGGGGLAFTGFPALLIVLAGLALIAAGVAGVRRFRDRRLEPVRFEDTDETEKTEVTEEVAK